MTDMLQKSENVAKNLANKNSQELTEQWKKGELSNGYYWIRLSWGGMVIMAYHTAFDGLFELDDHYYDSDEISAVLAPVPSYDEWQLMQDDNKRLKHDVGNLGYKIKNQRHEIDNRLKEIKQLKELLKECKEPLEVYNEMFGYKEELLTKIDEVLK